MPPVLAIENLRKQFTGIVAVDGISFAVHPGEIVGLLGPNGAGKTTTINMILGVLSPTAGTITIGGIDAIKQRSKALERTNFTAVYSQLPGNLTVEENLHVFGKLYAVKGLKERMDEVIKEFNLEKFRDSRAGILSSGEQSRLVLAKAMLN